MKGNPDVIAGLQKALAMEASLQLQYHACARMLKCAGLDGPARKFAAFGEDGEAWVSKVMKRLLLLEGDIAYTPSAVVDQQDVEEMYESALAAEMAIIGPYEQQIIVCMKALDDTTRNLYEHLLKWHQEGEGKQTGHVRWLEEQIRIIAGIGQPEYISAKI